MPGFAPPLSGSKWFCCQIGAREHYAIPRALHQEGLLDGLVTEAWVAPGSPFGRLKRSFRERYHGELKSAKVFSWNMAAIAFELSARRRGLQGWDRILARNHWFQERAVAVLSRLSDSQPTVFAYSYAALELFRFAKKRGWRTVLGQIDPGPAEERLVSRLQKEAGKRASGWLPAPARYWENWREECAMADRIVVNSNWSSEALTTEGAPIGKIAVAPLAYSAPIEAAGFLREYPDAFTVERPLQVLFLGQVNIRKGAIPLMDAMRKLKDDPIEFKIVGPVQVEVPADLKNQPRLRWLGTVPRGEAGNFYQNADVFLFPTFSDGFGLTQLEAQAWKLPIISSRFCGEVVRDGWNGLLLPAVTPKAIADALRHCIAKPGTLAMLSRNAIPAEQYSLEKLRHTLIGLADCSPIFPADVQRTGVGN
jgi:glycosyltransferase involved in cell wall biosynthesis